MDISYTMDIMKYPHGHDYGSDFQEKSEQNHTKELWRFDYEFVNDYGQDIDLCVVNECGKGQEYLKRICDYILYDQ